MSMEKSVNDFPIKEIESIEFGIFSDEDISRGSVAIITNNKLSSDGKNNASTVYDEKMGVVENNKMCATCKQDCKDCPGHYGHISLNTPIIHPLYYKQVVLLLRCFCFHCHKFVLDRDHIALDGILKYKKEHRFFKILEKIEKIDECFHCNEPIHKIKLVSNENKTYICMTKRSEEIVLSDQDVKNVFENISDDDISLIGFDPTKIKPINLIITSLVVLPPISRPPVVTEDMICDDDLTTQYQEIIKANNHLNEDGLNETKKNKYIQTLRFRITTLMNNSKGKARHTNGRPFKAIKERLTGKDGRIRNNLMGKRTNQSGRTVIGPDPTIRTDEMVVPEKIAKILTVPETVCEFNIEHLQKLVNDNKANYVLRNDGKIRINLKYAMQKKGTELKKGDLIIREGKTYSTDNGSIVPTDGDKIKRGDEILHYISPQKRFFQLKKGDVVERQLQNGDLVLLNRQPTLHKGSMLAKRIIIRPYKTFRLNLATTSTFNADFDGDEMNIHVAQQYDSRVELDILSATRANIMSSQSSKSNIRIVQDSLLGAFLLTIKRERIPIHIFNNILMKGDWDMEHISRKIKHIKKVLKELERDESLLYTGKGLVSFMLPDDFFYTKKTDADKKEAVVKIYKGVLYEGGFNKSVLGSTHNSIIQVLYKEYNEYICMDFINNIQFIANEWLCNYSFSLGIEDCIATKKEMINENVLKYFLEAKQISESTQHERIKEARINATLSKAKDIGMKIAKDALSEDNGFVRTVTAGSKGDFFNISQITGIIGQQNLTGNRMTPVLNRGKRTLPHYGFTDLTLEEEFESRGFIRSCFIKGLNPQEFWFHSTSGREGISDTAMKTANSGYTQRKMVKVMEDVQVRYDGTVRNSSGSIIQWAYSEDGLDRTNTVVADDRSKLMDISRIADKLNKLHEKAL